jgi:hypothetical protein
MATDLFNYKRYLLGNALILGRDNYFKMRIMDMLSLKKRFLTTALASSLFFSLTTYAAFTTSTIGTGAPETQSSTTPLPLTDGQIDTDGDGYHDGIDFFITDPNEWADADADGYGDNSDAFPNDASEWADADSDGVGDNADLFDNDPNEWADADSDGYGDNADLFDNDPNEWEDTNANGIGDNSDPQLIDSDGDGVVDAQDAFPNDALETADTDGDGVGDNADVFPNNANEWADSNNNGVGDNSDPWPNNNLPTVASAPQNLNISRTTPVNIDLSQVFSDQDGDSLTYQFSGLPTGFGLSVSGSSLTGTPTSSGTYTVTLSATDVQGAVSTTFTLTVTNAAPIASTTGIANQSFSSDLPITPINVSSAFTDSDGDSLTYSISGAPAGIQLNGSSIEGSTSAGGAHTITITASDGELTASTSFNLTIQDNSITGSYTHGYTTGNNMQWYRQDKWDLNYTSSSSLSYSTTGSGCSFGAGATTVTDADRPSGVILYKAPQTAANNISCSVTISNGSGVTESFTVNGQVKRIVAQANSSCSIASRSDINRNDIRVVNPFSTVGTYNSYWMICHTHGCAYTSTANGGQVWQVLGWGDYPSATVSQARSGGAWSLCKVGW